MEDCPALLATAKQQGIQVVGVAFHVGSGATSPQAFADAIAAARQVGLAVVTIPWQLCPADIIVHCHVGSGGARPPAFANVLHSRFQCNLVVLMAVYFNC